ncbi:hypothetical protein HNR06_000663 [Nocardiopsis arvandica]|uniref:Uncharacterized protein n=1 Tax=Nocardiopsis sinuspersici TaxID=501010 RepID=A0A7Y9X8N6_9ACTN|nr:hypothetical protein [Nocardiopsis sinuspersici]NYH51074.1 hypothetical protein [Nocardiopsis sinuspersici]
MDVPKLLESAALLVPEDVATENDMTLNDVWEYLAHDEWEVALGLLEELVDATSRPLGFWETLATAAEQMQLARSAAWCRWRCYEDRNGVIRADLALLPANETQRQEPVPGAGVLRPMWNIGNRTSTGGPVLDVARLWVESMPFLEPGAQASVRLAPLDPSRWQRLESGHVITMHEGRSPAGTAVVLDVGQRATTTPR